MLDRPSAWAQLRNVHYGVDELLVIEGFRQGRLEHVAWVLAALVLQKFDGELAAAEEVGAVELPVKLGQIKQETHVLAHVCVALRQVVLFCGLRVDIVLNFDECRVVQVHSVVNH